MDEGRVNEVKPDDPALLPAMPDAAWSAPGEDAAESMWLRRSLSSWLLPVAVAVVLTVCGFAVQRLVAENEMREDRLAVLQEMGMLRARLESVIASDLAVLSSVASAIRIDPNMSQADFAARVRAYSGGNARITHVAAARNLVVTHLYPLAGNEAALGLDYLALPEQLPQVLRARDSGAMILAGPLDLVQGGVGLVGRAPVFMADAPASRSQADAPGAFWGIVSAVIDVNAVWRYAGITDPDFALEVAIRGPDGSGADGDVFSGDPTLFNDRAVLLEVMLPGGSWQLAGQPLGGWDAAPPAVVYVRYVALGSTLIAVLFVLILQMQSQARARANEEVRRSRARMMDAIESISDGFALWDANDRLVLCNSRYRALYAEISALLQPGARFADLLRHCARAGLLRVDGGGRDWVGERLDPQVRGRRRLELKHRNGRVIQVDERRTADGGVVGIHTDITDMRRTEEDIRFRAYYDPLTALPNRARFNEQLERAIGRALRSGDPLAVLFIDLDRFKKINDTLGHDRGDELLTEAAARILSCVRSTDTVARLGGDEFTVLLEALSDEDQATSIAEKIIVELTRPFDLSGHSVYAGASIGISMCPVDSGDAKTLLRNADMAMYHAKQQGGNTSHYFTAEMTERAQNFVAIEHDLRLAVEREEFTAHFQPVIDIDSGRFLGAEALIRWEHPERGLVFPGDFIEVAEKSGLIVDMGMSVLRYACEEALRWPGGAQAGGGFVSVNVSCRQFKSGFDAEVVERVLTSTGLPAQRLVLEITESLLLEENDRVHRTLQELRDLGVSLAIDDFGTGYSSLSYLRRFPVTKLKIDRSFVNEMEHNIHDTRLVQSIVAMANALDLTPIAEGVETPGQAALLSRLECTAAQGYLFARPMPSEALRDWIAAQVSDVHKIQASA